MSMTQDEALKLLEYPIYKWSMDWDEREDGLDYTEAIEIAIAALRPVSREQLEKVWRGEWNQDERGRVVCNRCGSMASIGTENALHNAKKYDRFCFYCGAPMTDEAVEMVMERLEALHENRD